MLEWIRFGLVAFCFISATVLLFVSLFGTFRFGYSLNRLHAAAICDTLVLMLFVSGCIIASGINIVSLKFLLIILIQWCTSPLVSHMFVKAKYLTDKNLSLYCEMKKKDEHLSSDEIKKEGK